MNNKLTSKDKWEAEWSGIKLPAIYKPVYDVKKLFRLYLPKSTNSTFIEIGCAPGKYMAYFNKNFGYKVCGLEYAEVAAEMTKKNLEMQEIDAEILVQDFFTYDCKQNKYDVVFSAGFIEHFTNTSSVVQRLCDLSGEYVVTIVPNLYGVNGFISKTIRPKVFAEHHLIDAKKLEQIHKEWDLETMFCNYVGGIRFIMPGEHTAFFKKHVNFARAVNIPVRLLNRLSMEIGRILHFTVRSKELSQNLMYIGKKK